MPEPIHISAADGYTLGGFLWRQPCASPQRQPIVIINSATSVRCRYYERFANELHRRGCDVLTYDYRGIGESRQASLRRLSAGWLDWGEQDFEGVLQYVVTHFPGQPVYVVGHSVGGFVIGMAPSAHLIQRIFSMGAQFAYWRDYAPDSRLRMLLQWHLLMPLLARLFGYVPAKRLGWMEDTPKAVALNWAGMGPSLKTSLLRARETVADGFSQVHAPILALGVEDDPFGTRPALDRLLGYYRGSERYHLRLSPGPGTDAIGHFAFFHDRFRESLWPLALNWLLDGQLPDPSPGPLVHYPAETSHLPDPLPKQKSTQDEQGCEKGIA